MNAFMADDAELTDSKPLLGSTLVLLLLLLPSASDETDVCRVRGGEGATGTGSTQRRECDQPDASFLSVLLSLSVHGS